MTIIGRVVRIALVPVVAGLLICGLMAAVLAATYGGAIVIAIAFSGTSGNELNAHRGQFDLVPLHIVRLGCGAIFGATIGALACFVRPSGKLSPTLILVPIALATILAAFIQSLDAPIEGAYNAFIHEVFRPQREKRWQSLTPKEQTRKEVSEAHTFVMHNTDVVAEAGIVRTVGMDSKSNTYNPDTRMFHVIGSLHSMQVVIGVERRSDGPYFTFKCLRINQRNGEPRVELTVPSRACSQDVQNGNTR